ncbi:ADP-ribosylglycohydrolase [Catovirus CTV1]|uniref:ADP-ribosylglycohydrolase n=1 Tax=Catovirus CTV1 TaxID=1977631 RepID=A0A1V0SCA9_9VIRU|nr:ADP-ribosylglycohydrolase [Catovirus CTV1]
MSVDNKDNNIKNNDDNDIKNRFIACLTLSAVADTMSFYNGIWIDNFFKKTVTLDVIHELYYDFIRLGGINGIDLEGWIVSTNTLMSMGTAYALIDQVDFITQCRNYYITIFAELNEEFEELSTYRGINDKLVKVLEKLYNKDIDKSQEPYDSYSYDNNAAVRTASIGLLYNNDKYKDNLINLSIKCSQITNNSALGFLPGFTTSLFTSFAIKNIDVQKWPFLLLDILKSPTVLNYVKDENEQDYDAYLMHWEKYLELKFKNGNHIISRSSSNLIFRCKFFIDNFNDETYIDIGSTGYSAVLMAYDSILDCTGNWEKLLIYSGLHIGNTIAVATIAGAWYGAYYGWGDVPNNNLKYLEFKKELYDLGNKIYKKYKAL